MLPRIDGLPLDNLALAIFQEQLDEGILKQLPNLRGLGIDDAGKKTEAGW